MINSNYMDVNHIININTLVQSLVQLELGTDYIEQFWHWSRKGCNIIIYLVVNSRSFENSSASKIYKVNHFKQHWVNKQRIHIDNIQTLRKKFAHIFIVVEQMLATSLIGLKFVTLYKVRLYLNREGNGHLKIGDDHMNISIDLVNSQVRLMMLSAM